MKGAGLGPSNAQNGGLPGSAIAVSRFTAFAALCSPDRHLASKPNARYMQQVETNEHMRDVQPNHAVGAAFRTRHMQGSSVDEVPKLSTVMSFREFILLHLPLQKCSISLPDSQT